MCELLCVCVSSHVCLCVRELRCACVCMSRVCDYVRAHVCMCVYEQTAGRTFFTSGSCLFPMDSVTELPAFICPGPNTMGITTKDPMPFLSIR